MLQTSVLLTHKTQKHTNKLKTIDTFPKTKGTSELELNPYQLPSTFDGAVEEALFYEVMSYDEWHIVDSPVGMLFLDRADMCRCHMPQ
jgi:hypothetical protein